MRWLAQLRLAPPAPTPGDRPALITGVVLDPDGVPAPGISVLAELELPPGVPPPLAVSDLAGRFTLEVPLDYGTETSGWIRAGTAELGAAAQVSLERPGERPELELHLLPRLAIMGQVMVAGQPWAGAKVTAQLMGALHGDSLPASQARTDADGRFQVEALGAGVFAVTASVGAAHTETRLVQALVGERAPVMTLELPALVQGRVRVASAIGGGPVAGARIADGSGEELGETDGSGRALFMMPVGNDSVRLRVTHPRFGFGSGNVIEGEALVEMAPLALVRGRVVAPALGHVSIVARSISGYGSITTEQASTGSFELALAPGTWRLEAFVEGVGAAVAVTVNVPPGEVDAGVLLVPGLRGSLRGEVVAADGTPRAGALVVAYAMAEGAGASPHVLTGPDGRFELPDLPVGSWRIEGPEETQQPVVLAPGAPSYVRLELPAPEPAPSDEGVALAPDEGDADADPEPEPAEPEEPYGADDARPDFETQWSDDGWIVLSGDLPAGLLPGDRITAIDGISWEEEDANLSGHYQSRVVLTGVRPATGLRIRAVATRTRLPEYEDCH